MRYRKLEQWGTHSMLLRAFPCWHFLRLFFRESGKDCSSISITAPGHRPECLANDSTILAGKFCLAKPNVEVARNDSDEQQNLKVCLQQRHCFLYVHPILAVHQVQLPTSHSSILHLNLKSVAFFLACLLRILVCRQFWKVMRLRFADQMLFCIVKGGFGLTRNEKFNTSKVPYQLQFRGSLKGTTKTIMSSFYAIRKAVIVKATEEHQKLVRINSA
nr:hypothetical protein Iba_chr11bCG5860 [Ipomoea batatas]